MEIDQTNPDTAAAAAAFHGLNGTTVGNGVLRHNGQPDPTAAFQYSAGSSYGLEHEDAVRRAFGVQGSSALNGDHDHVRDGGHQLTGLGVIGSTHPQLARYNPGGVGVPSAYQTQPGVGGNVHMPQLNFGAALSPGSMIDPNHAAAAAAAVVAAQNGGMSLPNSPFVMQQNFGMIPGMGVIPYPLTAVQSPAQSSSGFVQNRMTGNYGPAAAAAAVAAAANKVGRTVYIGSIPEESTADELLNLVRFGPIENFKFLKDRNCVFISFLDGSTAAAFYADAGVKRLALRGVELRIGWGASSPVPDHVARAVFNSDATRNVFIGDLGAEDSEQSIREDMLAYGPIDQIKVVHDKAIAFVHFLSISVAMRAVADLPHKEKYRTKRVSYGKDRCAYVPKAQQAAVQRVQAQAAAAILSQQQQLQHQQLQHLGLQGGQGHPQQSQQPQQMHNQPQQPQLHQVQPGHQASPFLNMGGFGTPNVFGSPALDASMYPSAAGGMDFSAGGVPNRNIYLGNLHMDTKIEDLCNHIRGGNLQNIRMLGEKHCAFVTFVDHNAAREFLEHAQAFPITVNQRRLKVWWGEKRSNSISPALAQAIQAGATRNVYVGSITDFETFTEEKLRTDFGEFGEIELINFLKEKGAAFVNFTSIQAAQKAIEGIKANIDYANLRVAYGKDRCAKAPRRPREKGRTPSGRHETAADAQSEDGSENAATANATADKSGPVDGGDKVDTTAADKTNGVDKDDQVAKVIANAEAKENVEPASTGDKAGETGPKPAATTEEASSSS